MSFVLIIEDEEAVRRSMLDALELAGYPGIGASDGQEALELLQNSKEPPKVIILDMMMARMNGWEFLDEQRNSSEFSRIPVIVCSALEETARSVNPDAVLKKPIQLQELVDTVRLFWTVKFK